MVQNEKNLRRRKRCQKLIRPDIFEMEGDSWGKKIRGGKEEEEEKERERGEEEVERGQVRCNLKARQNPSSR